MNGQTLLGWNRNGSNTLPLKVGIEGGQYVLEQYFSSAGGVDDGFPYIWQITLTGDCSAVGTGFGQHELLGVNPDWIINQNFVFDGTNTNFQAHVDSCLYGNNINSHFKLHGGAPLPSTWLLLGSGILGLAAWRQFRKN